MGNSVSNAESNQTDADAAAPELSARQARAIDMRSQLLDAAETLYATEGPSALTNRRIGEQANTTTQAIYTYFGSRDELIDAMYRRAIASVEEILSLAASVVPEHPEETQVIAAFKDAANVYRRFCLNYPARFRMIRSAAEDVGGPVDATELRQMLVDAISYFGHTGTEPKSERYEPRVYLTLSAIHGFIESELTGFITDAHSPQALFEELVHRCLVPFDEIADL